MDRNHAIDASHIRHIRNLDGQCQVADIYPGISISPYLRNAQDMFDFWYNSRGSSRRTLDQRYISVKRFLNSMEKIKKHPDWTEKVEKK